MSFIEQVNNKIIELQTSLLTINPQSSVIRLQKAESSSIILTQLLSLRDRLIIPTTEGPQITTQNNTLRNALIFVGLLLIL